LLSKNERKSIVIIGSGFAGLSAAAVLARAGNHVKVLEKNEQVGGRARIWESRGFKFDMGPSWYWMPDVFDDFFALFGKRSSDFYNLVRLDPSYRVFFEHEVIDLPAGTEDLENLFEKIEEGAAAKLRKFLSLARYKYETGMKEYVFKPSASIFEFLNPTLLVQGIRLQLLKSMAGHVRDYFTDPRLVSILEFPVLFLGSTPEHIPALYSMMNFADMSLGTWYPLGGMHGIVKAMVAICTAEGVEFEVNAEVTAIEVANGKAVRAKTSQGDYEADFFISGSDYEHTDQVLLPVGARNYSEKYWEKRVLSPSALIYYVGFNRRIDGLKHHNLFFDRDFQLHAEEIYTLPQWPSDPLFYVCCPSLTDSGVAPAGCENLFFLMPIAAGLEDTEEKREEYFKRMLLRVETATGEKSLAEAIVLKRSYSVNDFIEDYHSFKGNAYGLANTLKQTAFLKPKMHSSQVRNFLYTGQLTVPGPGVPPAIISGRVAASEAAWYLKNTA